MHSVSAIQNRVDTPHLEVRGGNCLHGSINISGAKNSALILMAATLLSKEKVFIRNVPKLTDITVMSELLTSIGVSVQNQSGGIILDAQNLSNAELSYHLVHALRASFVCIAPLLARFGKVEIPLPGGCRIGTRPVDEHLKGLEALGASVSIKKDVILAKINSPSKKLKGARIKLTCKSVGATETILMAATLAEGTTVINNAAREPEIQDLSNMLNSMGARIKGAGTNQIIIEGVEKLNGCDHTVIPDRIEAGTFLIAAAITRSALTIKSIIPNHLESVIKALRKCGCKIDIFGDCLNINSKEINAVDITTQPYPGFPTDLQAPFMALMATAKGSSKITETIFEKRMQHVGELQRMGSSITLEGNKALVKGVSELYGTYLSAGDLRSSAAIVLASLAAKGNSNIKGLDHLDRGYEQMEEKLKQVGAEIIRKDGRSSAGRRNTHKEIKTINPQVDKQEVA